MRSTQIRTIRAILASAVSASVIGALTVATGASAAEPRPSAGPSTLRVTAADLAEANAAPSAMLRAMRRDLGVTADQARLRIASDRAATRVEQRMRRELGTTFAGAWIVRPTAGSTRVVVGTTDASRLDRIREAGATPKLVERSVLQLDRIGTKLAGASAASIRGWYVDIAANRIVVQVRPGEKAGAARAVARAGIDAEAVRVVETREQPRPLYDVRGGDAYYIGGSGRCSIGFPVQGGFATAGHCGTAGTAISGHNRVALGSVAASRFPGNDYGWVRITNSEWVVRPLVNDYRGGTVTVAGSNESPVGADVCRSGSTTGWHCGVIQAKNQSVTYPQGTVNGLTRTTVCAEPGDSGGSWLTGQQAQGVTSGGSGNCSSGGTTFYQPINPILSVYGLTLATSGGGDPDPPQGTWRTGASYSIGDQVTYSGTTYRCIQAHTAQPGWEPPNVPALWARA